MKKFESDYRLRENDDVLSKENVVHSDLDRRLDAVEQDAQAFRDGNRADIDAILKSLETTFSVLAGEMRQLLDTADAGLSADTIKETVNRYFLTDSRKADILTAALVAANGSISDAVGALKAGAPAGRDTLKALSDLISANATTAASNAASIAAITGGADPTLDTFVEVLARFASDETAIASILTALGNRLRTDTANQGLASVAKHNARFNASAAPWDALAYKNLAYNARQVISQLNGSNSIAAVNGYVTDGYGVFTSGLTLSAQRVANPFPVTRPDIDFGLRATVTTAKAALATGDYAVLSHTVEGIRSRKLKFGTVSANNLFVGMMLTSSVAATVYVSVRNGAANRSCVLKVSLPANVETQVLLLCPGDTAGTWASDNGLGLTVNVSLAAGTTFQTAAANAGTWQAGKVFAGADQTNMAATAAVTLTMSDLILLPAGASLTDPTQIIPVDRLPFFQKDDPDEVRDCLRYWEAGTGYSVGILSASAGVGYYEPFKVVKRGVPSIPLYSYTSYAGINGVGGSATTTEIYIAAQGNGTSGVYGYYFSLSWQADARLAWV